MYTSGFCITYSKRDEYLTGAFNKPTHVHHIRAFSLSYPRLALAKSQPGSVWALLIAYELDRRLCCYMISLILCLSIVLGIVTSVVTKRLDIGLAMSAAVSAWIACIEALLLWMYR